MIGRNGWVNWEDQQVPFITLCAVEGFGMKLWQNWDWSPGDMGTWPRTLSAIPPPSQFPISLLSSMAYSLRGKIRLSFEVPTSAMVLWGRPWSPKEYQQEGEQNPKQTQVQGKSRWWQNDPGIISITFKKWVFSNTMWFSAFFNTSEFRHAGKVGRLIPGYSFLWANSSLSIISSWIVLHLLMILD